MGVNVDTVTPGDVDDLVELFNDAGPFVSARGASDYWLYAHLFGSTCLCIRGTNGRPVAVLISFRDQTPGTNEIYIQDVAVLPDHRRQGFAEALLEELHGLADDWGVERVWLTSEPDNTAARTLWARHGYENLPADYEEGDVWMTRGLKGPGRDRAIFERRTTVGSTAPRPSND